MVPKTGEDHRFPASYRPLSMLNTNYKLIATTLANRVNTIVGKCVHLDQTGFICGRYLKNNIRKVLSITNKTQTVGDPTVLLFLDAKKAFDYMEWQYNFGVIEKYNFGPFFSCLAAYTVYRTNCHH